MLLMTALTAGSAVARAHGHDRRHAHPRDLKVVQPAVTAPAQVADVEKRGEEVSAVIDGKLVSWINNWFGGSDSSSEVAESTTTPTSTATAEATTSVEAISSVSATPVASSTSSASSSSSSGSSNWASYPSNGEYSTTGFGSSTASKRVGTLDWDYIGNVGSPWGSNIIQVEEHMASKYKHVLRFEGSKSDTWSVIVWNTYGPNGKMDGFWKPNKALSFEIEKGQTKYIAIDDNSQGGWAAAPGDIPTSKIGQYASTWGEFDMSNEKNDDYSGWDVSCIIAQLADLQVQGMQICNHLGEKCSRIGKGLLGLLNAYTKADQGNPSLAVSQGPGPVRLVVHLDFAGL